LEGRTLAEALAKLVDELGVEYRSRIRFQVAGGNHPIPQRVEIGLYRIAQEALNNALLHAHSQHITLELEITSEETRMAIKDDGQGFDPGDIGEDRFGLTGMNERAKLMAGTLNILTTPGTGTWLEVSVPTKGGWEKIQ
jgi:two-component system NarL family sensor kinase